MEKLFGVSKCSLLLVILLLHLCNAANFPVIQTDNYIYDLYSDDFGIFSTEAKAWALNGVVNPSQTKATFCAWYAMIGGFGVITVGAQFSRTYASLPTHDLITFTVTLLIIDTWLTSDEVEITVDSQSAFKGKPTVMIASGNSGQVCHQPGYDFINSVVAKLFHSGPSLTIVFTSTLSNQYAGTFGVKELKMRFTNATASDVKQSCVLSVGAPTDTICQCPSGYYYDAATSPTCQRCDSSCQECFGLTSRDCAACQTGASYVAESDSCIICASNCLLCSGPEEGDCKQCEENTFQYWNNSCKTDCPAPYTQITSVSTLKQCVTPCQASNAYMNWDNSCSSLCLPPFTVRIDAEAKFCDFPCRDDKKFYDPKEQKCRATCEYPYQLKNNLICELGLSEEDITYLENLGTTLGVSNNVSSIAAKVISFINFHNPAAMFLDVFADLLLYIKYMKVRYPPKVQETFLMKLDMPFQIIPDIPDSVNDLLPLYPIPEKFEEYEVHSSFLVNFWEQFIYLLAVIFAIIFVSTMGLCSKKSTVVDWVYVKLSDIFKWNFTFSLFTSYFGDIVLFTSLEFRTAEPITFLQALSFIICFIANLMAFLVFAKMIHVIYMKWKLIKKDTKSMQASQITELQNKLKQYESIFDSCKDQTIKQQALLCIFLGRVYIYVCIISYLYDSPLLQAILIILLSLSMLLYQLIERPPKSRVDLFQFVANELILFVAKVCVLILAVMDYRDNNDSDTRNNIGEVILGCNMAFSVVSVIYLCISLVGTIHNIWKFISKTCLKSKSDTNKRFKIILSRSNANAKKATQITHNIENSTNVQLASVPEGSNPKIRNYNNQGRQENQRREPAEVRRGFSTQQLEEYKRDVNLNHSNQDASDTSFQEQSLYKNTRTYDNVNRSPKYTQKFENRREISSQVRHSNPQRLNSALQDYSMTEMDRSRAVLTQDESRVLKDYSLGVINERNEEQMNVVQGVHNQQFLIQDETFDRDTIGAVKNGRIKARRDNRMFIGDY